MVWEATAFQATAPARHTSGVVRIAYFQDDDGSEPVLDYIRSLAASSRQAKKEAATIERTILLLEKATPAELVTQRLARLIDAKYRIWELRPGPHRVAIAVVDGVYVLLHAWRKTTPKLRTRELNRARSRLEELR